jgi:hypothetical protein
MPTQGEQTFLTCDEAEAEAIQCVGGTETLDSCIACIDSINNAELSCDQTLCDAISLDECFDECGGQNDCNNKVATYFSFCFLDCDPTPTCLECGKATATAEQCLGDGRTIESCANCIVDQPEQEQVFCDDSSSLCDAISGACGTECGSSNNVCDNDVAQALAVCALLICTDLPQCPFVAGTPFLKQ